MRSSIVDRTLDMLVDGSTEQVFVYQWRVRWKISCLVKIKKLKDARRVAGDYKSVFSEAPTFMFSPGSRPASLRGSLGASGIRSWVLTQAVQAWHNQCECSARRAPVEGPQAVPHREHQG